MAGLGDLGNIMGKMKDMQANMQQMQEELRKKKLKEKRLDMIVANTIAAIGSGKTAVQIKTRDSKWLKIASSAKAVIARKIISLAENM